MLDNGTSVPFYEYRRQDGTTFEIMQKMVDVPATMTAGTDETDSKQHHCFTSLARIIHDGSSRNRGAASRDQRAEPRRPEAYSCSTWRV